MKKVILSAGLLAVSVVAVRDARAQADASTSDKFWTVKGGLRGFYDDNYNTQPSGVNKKKSFGVEIRPSVSVLFNDGPNALSAGYFYNLRYFFARQGHQPDQDHRFEAAFSHKFNPNDSLKVSETFVDAQDPEVLNPGLITGAQRANGDNYHNNFDVKLNKQINNLLGFVVGYGNDWYRYTGALSTGAAPGTATYGTLLNRFEHRITVDSRWKYSDLTTFVVGYQYGITAHTSGGDVNGGSTPPAYVPATARDLNSHYIYGGVDHSFNEKLSASARLGILISDFNNRNQTAASSSLTKPGSTSPYIDLNAIYSYMDGGKASIGFTETQNSTDVSTTFNQVSEAVNAHITQVLKPLSPDLTADIYGSFQNSDYNGGPSNNGSDKNYAFGANLTYTFSKHFSTELGYNYNKLTSSIAGRNYSRNVVYIGLTGTL